VHPFNDEGCVPSTRRSPIKLLTPSPNESANCVTRGAGRRNAWPRRQICTAPMWAESSAASGTCLCGTSRSLPTHLGFPSGSYFVRAANLANPSEFARFPSASANTTLVLFSLRSLPSFEGTLARASQPKGQTLQSLNVKTWLLDHRIHHSQKRFSNLAGNGYPGIRSPVKFGLRVRLSCHQEGRRRNAENHNEYRRNGSDGWTVIS
jgi:hypothetical protein